MAQVRSCTTVPRERPAPSMVPPPWHSKGRRDMTHHADTTHRPPPTQPEPPHTPTPRREKRLDTAEVLKALSTIGVQESTDLARLTVEDLVEAGCAIVQARKLSEKGWNPVPEPNSPGGPMQVKLGDGELKLNVHILVRRPQIQTVSPRSFFVVVRRRRSSSGQCRRGGMATVPQCNRLTRSLTHSLPCSPRSHVVRRRPGAHSGSDHDSVRPTPSTLMGLERGSSIRRGRSARSQVFRAHKRPRTHVHPATLPSSSSPPAPSRACHTPYATRQTLRCSQWDWKRRQ